MEFTILEQRIDFDVGDFDFLVDEIVDGLYLLGLADIVLYLRVVVLEACCMGRDYIVQAENLIDEVAVAAFVVQGLHGLGYLSDFQILDSLVILGLSWSISK